MNRAKLWRITAKNSNITVSGEKHPTADVFIVHMSPRREDGVKARRKEYSVARIDISHTFLSYEYEFPNRHR